MCVCVHSCVCVCVDCKGPLDRALFTHPDRQKAVKNCTIFPLKSLQILRSNVFTAASLSLFSSFPLCVCILYMCERCCVCVCVCLHTISFLFLSRVSRNKKQKLGANYLRRRETWKRGCFFVPQTSPPSPCCLRSVHISAKYTPHPPVFPLLRKHLVVMICSCKNPQYDSLTNQPATSPRNVISRILGLI